VGPAPLDHRELAGVVRYAARAAIERGISPENLRQHFARDRAQRWLPIPGQLDLASFTAAACRASGRSDVEDRYQYKEDDDLFYFGGCTWALTTQLGPHTGDYVRSIGAEHPVLGLALC
jgi:hypothetical protein